MPPKVRIDQASLWANPQAEAEWKELCNAIDQSDSYPCYDNPDPYVDYPEDIGVDEAEQMCYGCPLLKQCYDFAVANNTTWGIWGGINFTPTQEQQHQQIEETNGDTRQVTR